MNLSITAYQIAEKIDIKRLRREFTAELLYSSAFELFYSTSNSGYLYIFDYGVAVFAGYDPLEASKTLAFLRPYCQDSFDESYREDFQVITGAPSSAFSFNSLHVNEISSDIIRITMLNVGQSAALDYYSDLTQKLMDSTLEITNTLETEGKFKISKRDLLKFIGKSMNIKRRIIDNIYILDEPDTIWESEILNKINNGLRETFDLRTRFRDLDYRLQISKDNLQLFSELVQHKESNLLEWIIIILITIEVAHFLISLIL